MLIKILIPMKEFLEEIIIHLLLTDLMELTQELDYLMK
jgi:hypothetical protein